MIRTIALMPLALLALCWACGTATQDRPPVVVAPAGQPQMLIVNPLADDDQAPQMTEQGAAMQRDAQAKMAQRAAAQLEAVEQERANEVNSAADYARMQTVEWRACYAAAFAADAKASYDHERSNPSGIVDLRLLHDLAEDVRNGRDMAGQTATEFTQAKGRAFSLSDCQAVYP